MEYRGIQLHESVKLYMKNGEYNEKVKSSLDKLADLLEKNAHVLLSEYISSHTKLLIDFKCGHDPHEIAPSHYKNGKGCPKCGYIESSKKQINESKEKFYKLVESEGYKIISEYKNAHKKITLQCDKGHIFQVSPMHFISSGTRCQKCSGHCSEQAEEKFYSAIEKRGYKVIGTYINTHIPIEIQCNQGHIYKIKPNSFVSKNYSCRKCLGTTPEQAREKFYQEIEKANFIRIGEYKGAHEKVKIQCDKGHIFAMSPKSFVLDGQRCRKCLGTTPEQAREKLLSLIESNGHVLLSPYINDRSKVLIDFKCKHEPHWIQANKYKNGRGCPKCSQSKGVKIICEWLEKNKIEYETEYPLPLKRWRYDIFVPSRNLIVEVHGLQHYEETFFNKKGISLKKQQETDHKKQKYAESLKYSYIEVDYRENIPELALERFLKAFSKDEKFTFEPN